MKRWMQTIGGVLLAMGVGGLVIPDTGAWHDWFHPTLSHNLIHMISGGVFLAVSQREQARRWTSLGLGGLYLLAAIWGLFTDNLFGVLPSAAAMDTLHLLIGAASLYTGGIIDGAFKRSSAKEAQEQVQSRDENP
jgi:Domain of unknown function (DUF4383)